MIFLSGRTKPVFEVYSSLFKIGYFDCRQGARGNDPGDVCQYVEESFLNSDAAYD